MTTLATPWGYALTVGVTSIQILPQNSSRKGLIFFNPSMTNTVSVCPALTPGGAALAAVSAGPGVITIIQGGTFVLPQPGWPDIGLASAFNAVASGAATPFTVWEF